MLNPVVHADVGEIARILRRNSGLEPKINTGQGTTYRFVILFQQLRHKRRHKHTKRRRKVERRPNSSRHIGKFDVSAVWGELSGHDVDLKEGRAD